LFLQAKDRLKFYRKKRLKSSYNILRMIKFFGKIIGLPVVLDEEKARAGEVEKIIISPEDGAFLGFLVFDPIEKKPKVVPSVEIKAITPNFALIKNFASITEIDDVVRIKNALTVNPDIIGSKVYTDSGTYLGRVNEATLSITKMELERIYVSAPFSISLLSQDLIIPLSKITKIESKKIYVQDGTVKTKAQKKVQLATATD